MILTFVKETDCYRNYRYGMSLCPSGLREHFRIGKKRTLKFKITKRPHPKAIKVSTFGCYHLFVGQPSGYVSVCRSIPEFIDDRFKGICYVSKYETKIRK